MCSWLVLCAASNSFCHVLVGLNTAWGFHTARGGNTFYEQDMRQGHPWQHTAPGLRMRVSGARAAGQGWRMEGVSRVPRGRRVCEGRGP
jgi:hypothetical protein